MTEEVVESAHTEYFNMKDFVADRAYLSKKVLEFIDSKGLVPLIPFKEKTKPNHPGIWNKMYEYFTSHYTEFMDRYHQRSRMENSFHCMKACWGGYLMTRNFDANVNEIKTMALCHNLTSLIMEMYESKLDVDFEACAKITRSCAESGQ